ncbi:MAG: ABC transporter permease [Candidatus Thorarchaeota archaeon]
MVRLTKENLKSEKSKVGISIGGVVLSVFLILTMMGLYYGFDTMMDGMVRGIGADLWVTSEGASGSLHSPSLLPLTLEENITGIEGVEECVPFIRTPVSTESDEGKLLLYINSYENESGMGGPWSIIEGRSEVTDGEIIVDKALAFKLGLRIGGNFTIEDRDFRVVGISDETNMMIAYFVFITFEDAKSFLLEGVTNYFLVKVESNSDLDTVMAAIENALSDISVSTPGETAESYKNEILGGFVPIFYVLSMIGLLVGIQVIGVMVYSLTMEKAREFGILKALGASNLYLYRVVVIQALAVSLLGFVIGSLIVPPLISFLQVYVPEFVVEITLDMVIGVSALGIVTGLIASVVPVRKLAGLDPALVFKEA